MNCNDFKCVVNFFTGAIELLIPLVIGLAVLLFLWGMVKYVSAGGDPDKITEARNYILFGVVALFVMLSVWGLVAILVHTFFPNGYAIPQIK